MCRCGECRLLDWCRSVEFKPSTSCRDVKAAVERFESAFPLRRVVSRDVFVEACRGLWMSARGNLKAGKRVRYVKRCECCGREFVAWNKWAFEHQRCCSRSCSWKLARRERPVYVKRCECCGREFVARSKSKFERQRFCSVSCKFEFARGRKRKLGKWIGGVAVAGAC